VPSEVSGVLTEILFQVNDVVKVGQTIAIIETEGVATELPQSATVVTPSAVEVQKNIETAQATLAPAAFISEKSEIKSSDRFYSPLVKNIATAEGISISELESIFGSGKDGRVTKEDILKFVGSRKLEAGNKAVQTVAPVAQPETRNSQPETKAVPVSVNGGDEIVEMDRMRKLISGYMTASLQTSAHVQSFIEVDVTNIVKWRDRVKVAFEKREGEKLTFTPIFMEAVAKAIKVFAGSGHYKNIFVWGINKVSR
jgi:2-oxoglutarate dehydrogenase E2 component (dihydrolipoamide succinyltransferase)